MSVVEGERRTLELLQAGNAARNDSVIRIDCSCHQSDHFPAPAGFVPFFFGGGSEG
jgi:hypothetical protein